MRLRLLAFCVAVGVIAGVAASAGGAAFVIHRQERLATRNQARSAGIATASLYGHTPDTAMNYAFALNEAEREIRLLRVRSSAPADLQFYDFLLSQIEPADACFNLEHMEVRYTGPSCSRQADEIMKETQKRYF